MEKKNKWKDFIVNILLLFIIALMVFAIKFIFVDSYDEYDESMANSYCRAYADEHHLDFNGLLNKFMYKGSKYYTCSLDKNIPKIYVFNAKGEEVLYRGQAKYDRVIDTLEGDISIGMYEDELVIVQKIMSEEELSIKYFNTKGECIFSLDGVLEEENEEPVASASDVDTNEKGVNFDGEQLVEE